MKEYRAKKSTTDKRKSYDRFNDKERFLSSGCKSIKIKTKVVSKKGNNKKID